MPFWGVDINTVYQKLNTMEKQNLVFYSAKFCIDPVLLR